jgi:hypothetical protein
VTPDRAYFATFITVPPSRLIHRECLGDVGLQELHVQCHEHQLAHQVREHLDRCGLLPQAEEARAGSEAAARKERMKQRTPRVDWAGLLKRTFDFDVFACARCGGRLKGVGVREGSGA